LNRLAFRKIAGIAALQLKMADRMIRNPNSCEVAVCTYKIS